MSMDSEISIDVDEVDGIVAGLRDKVAKLHSAIADNVAARKALEVEVKRMRTELARAEKILRAAEPKKRSSDD
jgi:hypothetical protein